MFWRIKLLLILISYFALVFCLIIFPFGFGSYTWWRGRPTMEGKTARGASSPAKPALHMPEPLSTTRAAASSSHILRWSSQKFGWEKIKRKWELCLHKLTTVLSDFSVLPDIIYFPPPPFFSPLPHLLGCLVEHLRCPYTESTFSRLLVTSGLACMGQFVYACPSSSCAEQ